MASVQIIGFSGKMGSGKNYLAERILRPMLNPNVPTLVCAFADQLKIDTIYQDRVAYERVYGQKDTESRQLLQRRGTENGRLVHGEDVWIRCMQAWIRTHTERGIRRFLITDVRFVNEAEWIRAQGGTLVRVDAPDRTARLYEREKCSESAKSHPSETQLDDYRDFHMRLSNGDNASDRLDVLNRMRDLALSLDAALLQEKMSGVQMVVLIDLDDTICKCAQYYQECIEATRRLLFPHAEMNASQTIAFTHAVEQYVKSFERRYYTRSDFIHSLLQVARECQCVGGASNVEDSISALSLLITDSEYTFLEPHYPQLLQEYVDHPLVHPIIYTLGDRADQMRKLCALGLSHIDCEIVPHKDTNTLLSIRNKYESNDNRKIAFTLIGDSFTRDVLPAIEAKFETVVHITKGTSKGTVITQGVDCCTSIPRVTDLLSFANL